MKIEIGESLLLSYLKHVKKCVLYQTNWKASSRWDKSSKAEEEYKIIEQTDFKDAFKQGFNQLMKQSEIDAIGMNFNNKIIYACDIAFHTFGLQYGDTDESTNRVLKKLLRTYLTLIRYFPDYEYEILFASPKVYPAVENRIIPIIENLNNLFSNKRVKFFCYLNDDFKDNILNETMVAAKNDSDTNELFIRSMILNELSNTHKNGEADSRKVEA